MLSQMGSGKINSNVLYQSGMVNEVTRRTGMNEADAEKALSTALAMFGKSIGSGAVKSGAPTRSKGAASAGRSMKSSGIKGGKKIKR
jgi:hypothetical protein